MSKAFFLKNIVWICLLGCQCLPGSSGLFAQQAYSRFLDATNELPSSLVYRVLQDKQGFMWFCTDNGVCRYDGQKMEYYDKSNGFPDHGAFDAQIDSRGRTWFVPFNGKICYYESGTFRQLPFLRYLKNTHISCFRERNDTFWLSTRSGHIIKATGNKILLIKHIFPPAPITDFTLSGNDVLFFIGGSRLCRLHYRAGTYELINCHISNDVSFSRYPRFMSHKGKILISYSKGLLVLDSVSGNPLYSTPYSRLPFNSPVPTISTDAQNRIWIACNEGVFCFENDSFSHHRYFIAGASATNTCVDHEGNIWAASSEGVYYIKQHQARHLNLPNKKDQRIKLVFTNKEGSIYGLTDLGWLWQYLPDLRQLVFKQKISTIRVLHDYTILRLCPDSDIILSSSNYLIVKKHGQFNRQNFSRYPTPFYYNQDTTWSFNIGIGIIRKVRNRPEEILSAFPAPLNADYTILFRLRDRSGRFWFSSRYGAFFLDGKNLRFLHSIHPGFSFRHTDMQELKDGSIWMATAADGIFIWKNNRISHITTAQGLPSNQCKDLLADGDTLWIATSKGVVKLQIDTQNQIRQKMVINASNGLASNDTYSIVKQNDTLYVGTSTGLSVISLAGYKPLLPEPRIWINKVRTGNTDYFYHDQLILAPGTRDMDIEFSGISFASGNDILYKYMLSPIDHNWQLNNSGTIRFGNLKPGDYTFVVYARNASQVWSSEPATLNIHIEAFWWQTRWFFILSLLLAGGIIYLFTRYRIQEVKHKERLQRGLIKSELDALRAQMNPHFIFNSLNSIQDFILDHKPEEANYYMNRFATLMRLIIDYSKKERISLRQEIEFLTLYLELEQLRFSKRLHFTIDASPALDLNNTYTPPMFIQPLVENAIKYASFNKDSSPSIEINITEHNQFLTFIVSDNGPGFKRVREIQHERNLKHHQSVGLKNITERLRTITRNKSASLLIQDIEQNGIVHGTSVTIQIPLIYSNYDQNNYH